MILNQAKKYITSGELDEKLSELYGEDKILSARARYLGAIGEFERLYGGDRDIEIFRRLNPGDKSDDPKIADIMPYARRNDIFKDKYFKLEPDTVCKTITAHMKFDCNMYIHPMH